MASKITICNQAISWLGGTPLVAFDDSTEGRLCSANYDDLREAVLEEMNWSFAISDFDLGAPLADKSLIEGYNKFALLPEVLRVIAVYDGRGVRLGRWELRNREIVIDSDIVIVKAIFNLETVSKFSRGFRQCLAARIAAELALPLTSDAGMQTNMWNLYGQKLAIARTNDNLQGVPQKLGDGLLSQARKRRTPSGYFFRNEDL